MIGAVIVEEGLVSTAPEIIHLVEQGIRKLQGIGYQGKDLQIAQPPCPGCMLAGIRSTGISSRDPMDL
jgi:hypothetical protein